MNALEQLAADFVRTLGNNSLFYNAQQLREVMTNADVLDLLAILLTIKYPPKGKPVRLQPDVVQAMLEFGLLDRDSQGVFIASAIEDFLENWLNHLSAEEQQRIVNAR